MQMLKTTCELSIISAENTSMLVSLNVIYTFINQMNDSDLVITLIYNKTN
jgi:hypothetical protein